MKYVANPVVVEAFRIVEVGAEVITDAKVGAMVFPGAMRERVLGLESGDAVIATSEMLARMTPQIGDYWVIQSDGYTYLNPKDVFERKYSAERIFPATMYKLVDGRIETAAGIVDAAHEAHAAQNGWSREKPEAAAVSPVVSVEDRLKALEEKVLAIIGVKP